MSQANAEGNITSTLTNKIPPPNISFRFAERDDCAIILRFIHNLAKYEHMGNDVVATDDLLAEWLFDKHAAEVLFAVVDGLEIGFALFFSSFSSSSINQFKLYICFSCLFIKSFII